MSTISPLGKNAQRHRRCVLFSKAFALLFAVRLALLASDLATEMGCRVFALQPIFRWCGKEAVRLARLASQLAAKVKFSKKKEYEHVARAPFLRSTNEMFCDRKT